MRTGRKPASSKFSVPRFPGQRVPRLDQLLEEARWDHADLIKVNTDGHKQQEL